MSTVRSVRDESSFPSSSDFRFEQGRSSNKFTRLNFPQLDPQTNATRTLNTSPHASLAHIGKPATISTARRERLSMLQLSLEGFQRKKTDAG